MDKGPPPVAGALVLGIDAAWTAQQPSGVALVEQGTHGSKCVAVSPSYDSFLALAEGIPLDWTVRPIGSRPAMGPLLAAAERLGGRPVDLIAFDMPLSTEPICTRREADRQVSQVFGSRGCAVHSPTVHRPGKIANDVRESLQELGYPLKVAGDPAGPEGVIEVYPHVALLALLQLDFRLPYKVSRSSQYWKAEQLPVAARIQRLLERFGQIRAALEQQISSIALSLPASQDVASLASLKPLEDVLDALICAWVGMEHLHGRTRGLGDRTAAIWCPAGAFRPSPRERN